MRIGRFSFKGRPFEGQILGDRVRELGTERVFCLEELIVLAPVTPSKIVAAGLNYRQHEEHGHILPASPLIFLKPPSSLTIHGAGIPYPAQSREVYFEGELAVVIRRRASSIMASQANDYILGYCCSNDVTAWDILMRENNFGVAKSFDGFTPVGPWVETDIDPSALCIETRLNGELRQNALTSDLVFPVPELIAFISRVMTLEPGDLILTGTPPGMGPMSVGDQVEVTVEGIGSLCNGVCRPVNPCDVAITDDQLACVDIQTGVSQ
ncbi:MAG: fumarylacetoacetate hydrolase family protein [Deltaproteobacteria bacterium]|jgi:2-keto-4-pentenoate hydratase/2-oxohepta-3-ene-1,7-dioic acid hydratase in catechol pathway|nr:fumarylacetoacetate hydrolase family protein [Deltaproteobacteria bacterium]MBW2504118.1 fumarylacetoacetate hydrolase family protein [Deltaproteobacteria bacterium]MBW2519701.1 fumarylacetoacetate hydrolase family protein [Deltaproteobacteria bacterium]